MKCVFCEKEAKYVKSGLSVCEEHSKILDTGNKDEIQEKLKALETKIDTYQEETNKKQQEAEKKSKISTEDSLFFGLIISLVLLFFGLPRSDMISFFEAMNSSSAKYSAIIIQYFGFIFFLLSSITRFVAATSEEKLAKVFRYWSVEWLIIGFEFIFVIIILNLGGLHHLVWSIVAAFIIGLTVISFGMDMVEKTILKNYQKKDLIMDKPIPIASRIFLPIAFLVNVLSLTIASMLYSISFNPIWGTFLLVVTIIDSMIIFLKYSKWISRKWSNLLSIFKSLVE
jgi:hypothetical protein